ncbi:MAG: hypothetical protein ACO1PZ_15660 [Gammaproteobacteria bacterium]
MLCNKRTSAIRTTIKSARLFWRKTYLLEIRQKFTALMPASRDSPHTTGAEPAPKRRKSNSRCCLLVQHALPAITAEKSRDEKICCENMQLKIADGIGAPLAKPPLRVSKRHAPGGKQDVSGYG